MTAIVLAWGAKWDHTALGLRQRDPGGGTQYKSGYRDVPQTWVAKSGRQVHQWVPFFSKTWYFDGSIFQNFLKFAPKWRKFGTLIGQLFKISRNLRQNGANFSENFWFLVHGWVTFPSKWVHGWVAFQKSQRHTPTQTKVKYPPPRERDRRSRTRHARKRARKTHIYYSRTWDHLLQQWESDWKMEFPGADPGFAKRGGRVLKSGWNWLI